MHLPKNEGGDFTPPPAGTHLAVCYRFVDLGTQDGTYLGQPKRQHKVMLSWEFPDEKMEDGRPFTISQRYTWSMSERATLRQHLESWRGLPFDEHKDFGPGGFDIKNVLGKGCQLTVIHEAKNGKTYANIRGVTRLMKGITAPPPVNPLVYVSLDPTEFDRVEFNGLSDGLKTLIEKSPEYGVIANGGPMSEGNPPPNDGEQAPF